MSKRINISIPDADYQAYKSFKAQCRKNKKSVSEEILRLVKLSVTESQLPDFLK